MIFYHKCTLPNLSVIDRLGTFLSFYIPLDPLLM
nr:MAG TPA: hypothetical protein [Caudoviricetes sp.]